MKKNKRLFIAVVVTVLSIVCAFLFSACIPIETLGSEVDGASDPVKGENGKSAYEIYLSTLDDPSTALTEEQWLLSLAGTGVESVEMSEDGGSLIFTFSDGTTQIIEIPKSSHTHAFDEPVCIIPPASFKEGLGYKTCPEDGYNELVVFPALGYKITVIFSEDETPLPGVTVTVNGKNVVTDNNGIALIPDIVRGQFTVSATLKGYVYNGNLVTGDSGEYMIALDRAPKATHTVTVACADGEPVGAGVTVKAVLECATASTGITDENGKAVLSVLPDNYILEIDFGERADEFEAFAAVTAEISFTKTETELTVVKIKRAQNQTVVLDGSLTAKVTATSDEDVFVLEALPLDYVYTFNLSGGYVQSLTVSGDEIFQLIKDGTVTEDFDFFACHYDAEDKPSEGDSQLRVVSVSSLEEGYVLTFTVCTDGNSSVEIEISAEL